MLCPARERWSLTRRQCEVLQLVVEGRANKEIASVLGCAPGTVELHVNALLRKAGAKGRTALVARFFTA